MMKDSIMNNAEKYRNEHRRKKLWYKVMVCMAAVVIFCTVYALILPAVTMSQENPRLSASQTTTVPGSYLALNVSARAEDGSDTFLYLLAHQQNAGIDLDFNENNVTVVTDQSENTIELHREPQEDGTVGYWYILPGTADESDLSFNCINGIGDFNKIVVNENTPADDNSFDQGETEESIQAAFSSGSENELEAGEEVFTDSEEPKTEKSNIPVQNSVITKWAYQEGNSQAEGNVTYTAGSGATLEEARQAAAENSGNALALSWRETSQTIETTETTETTENTENIEDTENIEALESSPLDITSTDYVTGVYLAYQSEEQWIPIDENVSGVPADAKFKITVDYQGIPIESLKAAGGSITYQIPDSFINVQAVNGSIQENNSDIGTITVENNLVTIQFSQDWLNAQEPKANVHGDFYVTGQIKSSSIGEGGRTEISFGKVTVTVNFDDDAIAKYGKLSIEKTINGTKDEASGVYTPNIIQTPEGDYLEYTLTVKTYEQPMPDVSVVDTLNGGSAVNYVEAYIVPQEVGNSVEVIQPGNTAGKIVWPIGNMAANETRTLTYRVKLMEGYTGGKDKGSFVNFAQVFSKTYPRGKDSVTAAPIGNATVNKTATSFATNSVTGEKTATYTITVTADSHNSYKLDCLRLHDVFNNVAGSNNRFGQYVSYVPESFQVKKGDDVIPVEARNQSTGTYPGFDLYLPAGLGPGETYTVSYQVKIDPRIMAYLTSNQKVSNTASLYDTNSNGGEGTLMNSAGCTKDLEMKRWTRKLQGGKSTSEFTFDIGGGDSVYTTADGENFTEVTGNKPASYTVPAGSYKYNVLVNEAGDWDISSSTLRDTFSDGLVYSGYVRIDAYSVTEPGAPGEKDDVALARFQSQSPAKTVWLNVNGLKTFKFSPKKNIGLNGKYAYILTYYAVLNNVTGNVNVTNTFYVGGPAVGPGGGDPVKLDGVKVTTNTLVEGEHAFSASKHRWYYDRFDQTWNDGRETGTCWFYIEVDGHVLDTQARIKDIPHENDNLVAGSEIYGLYHSAHSPGEYKNLQEFINKNGTGRLEENEYTLIRDENNSNNITVQFTQDYTVTDGEKLYILSRIRPSRFPGDSSKNNNGQYTGGKIYNNLKYSGDGGLTWSAKTWDGMYLSQQGMVLKEGYSSYTYDKNTGIVKCLTDSRNRKHDTGGKYLIYGDKGITESGTYVEYGVNINLDGEMSGNVWVSDRLPQGLEPVYVRAFWAGSEIDKSKSHSAAETELDNDSSNWKKYSFDATGKEQNLRGTIRTTYYYNPANRELRWLVTDLVGGCQENKDKYNIEFQIVCRVTDENVLMGNVEKTYTNTATVTTEDNLTQTATADVSVSHNTLSKLENAEAARKNGRYPFKIDMNPLGEDLLKGDDSLTLVDEMGERLTLDVKSVSVFHTDTKEAINGWKLAVDTNGEGHQVFTLSGLPDKTKLTVTYETIVNAAPGDKVNIVNRAYWFGYAKTGGSQWEEESYEYTAGGTAGTDASLMIQKLDGDDAATVLSGAEFKLEELETIKTGNQVTYNNEGVVKGSLSTSNDGTAEFTLKFNTVYRVTETKAPEGYVLNSEPYLFAVAKSQRNSSGTNVYPTFPENVRVEYQNARHTYTVYNYKPKYSITVNKKFKGTDGTDIEAHTGTYRFGLFKDQVSSGKPIHTLSITYTESKDIKYELDGNTVDKPKFTQLDSGTYYVYELDESGNPVQAGNAFQMSNITFIPSYEGNGVTLPSSNGSDVTVSITNQIVSTVELPQTGGPGTAPIILAGMLMVISALALLRYKQVK